MSFLSTVEVPNFVFKFQTTLLPNCFDNYFRRTEQSRSYDSTRFTVLPIKISFSCFFCSKVITQRSICLASRKMCKVRDCRLGDRVSFLDLNNGLFVAYQQKYNVFILRTAFKAIERVFLYKINLFLPSLNLACVILAIVVLLFLPLKVQIVMKSVKNKSLSR